MVGLDALPLFEAEAAERKAHGQTAPGVRAGHRWPGTMPRWRSVPAVGRWHKHQGRLAVIAVSGISLTLPVTHAMDRGHTAECNGDVVCAVMAAGNANDHRRTIGERPLVDAVIAGEVRRIDLLRLTVGGGPGARTRYAHSYIGVGLTPVVAVDLERGGKGALTEIVSVIRSFARFRPLRIELEDGSRARFDSLVFANISQMANYATLSETGRPDDGRFEVIAVPHTAKWQVLWVAFKAVTRGLGPQPTAGHYAFTTLTPTPLQLDGEVLALDAGTPVRVDIAPKALATLG
jgi:diacylglycerol kinase (ATP)